MLEFRSSDARIRLKLAENRRNEWSQIKNRKITERRREALKFIR